MTDSFFGQPMNSVTALGFVLVGLVLVKRTSRQWVAVGSIGTGIGSFLFHGPMPEWAQLAHDVTLWILIAVAVIAILSDLRRDAEWRGLVAPLALLAVVAIIGRLGATNGPMCNPGSILQPHALWHVGAATALLWWALRFPGTKY